MVSLKVQKRLAASVLKVGKRRVWIDPNEANEVSLANSRKHVRKLVKDGLIMRKPQVVHSRVRAQAHKEAVRKGRHTGTGHRQGTAEARMPTKVLWIRHQRVLRRLLRRYRDDKKLDHTMYHEFYLAAKGNQFKNKRVLIDSIHKAKNEAARQKALEEQQNARRQKSKKTKPQV
jgi:large subunit ribosomal protein L19e